MVWPTKIIDGEVLDPKTFQGINALKRTVNLLLGERKQVRASFEFTRPKASKN
jgi:hypothetical protein